LSPFYFHLFFFLAGRFHSQTEEGGEGKKDLLSKEEEDSGYLIYFFVLSITEMMWGIFFIL